MTEPQSFAELLADLYAARDRIARLECALAPFATQASVYSRAQDGMRLLPGYDGSGVLVADLREAQRLLRERE